MNYQMQKYLNSGPLVSDIISPFFQETNIMFLTGPKIYQLTYKCLKTQEVRTISKVKGFYLRSEKGREVVHDKLFKHFVDQYLKDVNLETRLGQWQIKTTKEREMYSVITQKVLKNSIFSKRVSFRGEISSLQTLPYGYSEEMFNKLIHK